MGKRFWDEALLEAPEPWEQGSYEVQMGFGSERPQQPPLSLWNSWKSPRRCKWAPEGAFGRATHVGWHGDTSVCQG